MNPWKLLHNFPPALIRLLARRRVHQKTVRALSLQEIAIGADMPLTRVQVISQAPNWEGITIPEAERFCAGCNFDPLKSKDRNRHAAYLRSCKNQPFRYLKNSSTWKTEHVPNIRTLARNRKRNGAGPGVNGMEFTPLVTSAN